MDAERLRRAGAWINVLALQFHPEAIGKGFERWLIGHACELFAAGIDPDTLRGEATIYSAPLEFAAAKLIEQWLIPRAVANTNAR